MITCDVCNGKGFTLPGGRPVNAFEGSDLSDVRTCRRCGGEGKLIGRPKLYKGKTAEQWRAAADQCRLDAVESFDRCDTDGFRSQWASGVMAARYRTYAHLAEAGGVWEFPVLLDSEGKRIDSGIVDTKYGCCYILKPEAEALYGRKFVPSNNGRVWKQHGFQEGMEEAPATVVDTEQGGCIVRARR